jgi:hypothetical protein
MMIGVVTGVTEETMPNIVSGGGPAKSTGRTPSAGKNKAPSYYCTEEAHNR